MSNSINSSCKFYKLLSHILPFWQNFPSNPGAHVHLLGAVHRPPFMHSNPQTAAQSKQGKE